MSMVQLPGGINFPQPQIWAAGSMPLAINRIDASAEKYAMTFVAPKSGTLHGFEFNFTTAAQTAANGLRMSFHNLLSGSNLPDLTTTLAYRVITSGITASGWATSGIMTDDGTDTGVPLTVVRGQRICCVIQFESFQAGDLCEFYSVVVQGPITNWVMIYAASWTVRSTDIPVVALKYTDGTYPMLTGCAYPNISSGVSGATYVSTGVPDEVGTTFSFPTDVLIGGAWIRARILGDASLNLYDSANVLMHSTTINPFHQSTNAGSYMEFLFDKDYLIKANETYRLTVKSLSSSDLVSMNLYVVNDLAMLDLLAGGGSWRRTERTDSGAFSETSLQRLWMGVRITGIDQEIGGQPSIGFTGTE